MENIVQIQSLTFSRGDRVILEKMDLRARKGEVTAILGTSGSGKTTLLKLMGGQLHANQGSVQVQGKELSSLSRKELYDLRRSMGMLFQSGALFSDLTVFENVAFPLREHTKLSKNMIRDLVLMKLQAVGLRGARTLMPSELSGGMARRVALARAISLDPSLIMYDEPFAGQDPISKGVLVQLIRLLNDSLNMSTVIVSHDLHETISIADYVYIIANGCVVGEGAPKELMQNQEAWVQQFMQGLPDGPIPFHYPAQDYSTDLLGGEQYV